MRRGDTMTCHPTDHAMTQATGGRVPESVQTHECTGAIILIQRELQYLQESPDYRTYRQAHPRGLTRDGAAEMISRLLFGGVMAASTARPNLNELDIQHPTELGTWEARTQHADTHTDRVGTDA